MIKAVIVEDEAPLQNLLKMLIAEIDEDIHIAAAFGDVESAINGIEQAKPQLVFLDVMLPGGTGFDVLEQLGAHVFEVIFVTAYDNFMLEAFRHAAAGYVLKPVDKGDLKIAISNARKRLQSNASYDVSVLLKQLRSHDERLGKIALPTQDGFLFVKAEDIIRCESDKVYTWVYLKDRKQVLCSYNLGEFRRVLPEPEFFQVHKSHIISLRHVISYNGRDSVVTLDDSSEVPVSRRNKNLFLSNFALVHRTGE